MLPQNPSGVRVDFDVPATMRDGTVLRANVFRPDDDGSYPVLLTRLPYGKDLPLGGTPLNPAQAARRGYVVVVQDVRGTFTSEGTFDPMRAEGTDGVDTVRWAASLPGSNGVVGMYGVSYFGFTQWAAAREGAEALRAMAPIQTWANPHQGVATRNGVMELGLQASWTMQTGLDQLVRRYRGDAQALGRALYGMAREFNTLPTTGYAEVPLERFGPLARLGLDASMTDAVRHRTDLEFAAPGAVTSAYERLSIPVLHIAGWYDIFLDGTIRNFQGMRAAGRPDQYLVIGPWTHGAFGHVVGELDFGFAAGGMLIDLQIDLVSLNLQFFDRYLKGIPNGFDRQPPVKYFVMGANVWRSSETWPPRDAALHPWYLHSGGRANTGSGDGSLSAAAPAAESADTYVYDPARPVPTVGGATLMHPLFKAGPYDQRGVEAREDVLVYTSEPLAEPLEIAGPVRAVLFAATDAPDTDFVARLIDVHPDGRAMPLTDGVTRMSLRNGLDQPAPPLQPGEVYRIEIDLWATAVRFGAGHRIRLDVTSSNFPRWERNLNTGSDSGQGREMRVARQTVLHDSEHPSCLLLPVIAG